MRLHCALLLFSCAHCWCVLPLLFVCPAGAGRSAAQPVSAASGCCFRAAGCNVRQFHAGSCCPCSSSCGTGSCIYCCAAWPRAAVACISSSMQWWKGWFSLWSWVSVLVVVASLVCQFSYVHVVRHGLGVVAKCAACAASEYLHCCKRAAVNQQHSWHC